MTSTELNLASLSTSELSVHLAVIAGELGRRADHNATQLVRTIETLGRSMGELGGCLGNTRHRPALTELKARPALAPVALTIAGVNEARPAQQWLSTFEATWPSYRAWYGSEGWGQRPTLEASEAAMRQHLPELVPMWRHLTSLAGDDPEVARMLSLWNPPAFAPGCSQLVEASRGRALMRNYDYDPALFEGVSLSSHWGKRRVIGTSDCLWGLLDGMNDAGLAVSLTFGGVPGTGEGFAIPLVLRYLLEVCDTVQQAHRVLERVPVAASYNLTLTDRSGAVSTVFVAPGRAPEYFDMPLATNHRGLVPDRPELARRFRSVERQDVLRGLDAITRGADAAAEVFLSPALRSTDFEGGFGTLYTADYRPDDGVVTYRWPGTTWRRTFTSSDDQVRVRLR